MQPPAPLFLADVAVEYVAPIVGGMSVACVAMWRRLIVEREREDAWKDANMERMIGALAEVVDALKESTDAIREMRRAG